MGAGIEFDWDAQNIRHLNGIDNTDQIEQLMTIDPVYVEHQTEANEERYKVLGVTEADRVFIGIWTPREGKIRAVTA